MYEQQWQHPNVDKKLTFTRKIVFCNELIIYPSKVWVDKNDYLCPIDSGGVPHNLG